jgi:hypothetical protein
MRIKRWFKRSLLLGIIVAAVVTGISFLYRPATMERTEIYKGVYLTVEELPKSAEGSGRVMIAEVHWKTPGVRIANRPFDYQFSPENPIASHYNLTLADWALSREGAALLVNTTRYAPDAVTASYPGNAVRSVETVVTDGRVSHVHDHSYLIFWDDDMEAHLQTSKPPSPENLERARMGIGIQGIQISEGIARMNSIADRDLAYDRTFIGVDPEKHILTILVFEKATAYLVIQRALEAGVMFGGQVDSGSASHLLIGKNAGAGIRSHTGIRNWRPLGAYLTVHADPL